MLINLLRRYLRSPFGGCLSLVDLQYLTIIRKFLNFQLTIFFNFARRDHFLMECFQPSLISSVD